MESLFHNSFRRDVKAIKNRTLLQRLQQAIEEVEVAKSPQEVSDLAKIKGAEDCYRIRIGDFRICVIVRGDIVEFVRFLNRSEVYKYFP